MIIESPSISAEEPTHTRKHGHAYTHLLTGPHYKRRVKAFGNFNIIKKLLALCLASTLSVRLFRSVGAVQQDWTKNELQVNQINYILLFSNHTFVTTNNNDKLFGVYANFQRC